MNAKRSFLVGTSAVLLVCALLSVPIFSYATDEVALTSPAVSEEELLTPSIEEPALNENGDASNSIDESTESAGDSTDLGADLSPDSYANSATPPLASEPSSKNAPSMRSASASSDESAKTTAESPITLEGSTLYANGTSIVIKKDTDSKAYVFDAAGTTKLDESPLGSSLVVYGGGKKTAVEGNTSITIDGVYVMRVYGGGYNAPVSGSTQVTIKNVNTGTVYGGGYSDGTGNADVAGNATVTINGTANAGPVYGGGYAIGNKGDANASVLGASSVMVSAVPTSNHGNLYGGGHAESPNEHNAKATVGSASLNGVGRTSSVRGGGYATAKNAGSACADVLGPITLQMSDADIREVYSGGYADGANASATAVSVNTTLTRTEVMMLYGGGTASGGVADVSRQVNVVIDSSPNLYGYTLGGGEASSGGSADVAATAITIRNSNAPIEEQNGSAVAQAIYLGGESKTGSHANISGAATLTIEGGTMAGNIYGGGSVSGGASGTVGSSSISINGTVGSDYNGDKGYLSVFAAGETDGTNPALAQSSASVALNNTTVEHVWGAVTANGTPTAPDASVSVRMDNAEASTIACVDEIDTNATVELQAFLWKADETPTMVTTRGLKTGDVAIACADTDSAANWFALRNGAFDYIADENGKSVWKIAERHASAGVENVGGGESAPTISVPEEIDLADSVMTEDDKQALQAGSTVEIILQVAPKAPEELDEQTQSAVTEIEEKSNITVATYLDIELLKVIDGTQETVTNTPKPVRLTFAIPAEYLVDGVDRTFSVVRTHQNPDGSLTSEVLPDLDDDPATVTIETDKFSVYALAYADSSTIIPPTHPTDPGNSGNPSGGSNGSGNGNSPVANDPGSNNPTKLPGVNDPVQNTKAPSTLSRGMLYSKTGDNGAALAHLYGGIALAAGITACAALLRLHARRTRQRS